MKFSFHKRYFVFFVFVFLVEAGIAMFVNDRFIRPFVGDILVILLIYAFIRTFYAGSSVKTAIAIFIFACLVEVGQYYKLANVLQLGDTTITRILLGSTFDWKDILAYSIGTITIIMGRKNTNTG